MKVLRNSNNSKSIRIEHTKKYMWAVFSNSILCILRSIPIMTRSIPSKPISIPHIPRSIPSIPRSIFHIPELFQRSAIGKKMDGRIRIIKRR